MSQRILKIEDTLHTKAKASSSKPKSTNKGKKSLQETKVANLKSNDKNSEYEYEKERDDDKDAEEDDSNENDDEGIDEGASAVKQFRIPNLK